MNSMWNIPIAISIALHALIIFGALPHFDSKSPKTNKKIEIKKEVKITTVSVEKTYPQEKMNASQPIRVPAYIKTTLNPVSSIAPKIAAPEKPQILDRGEKIITMPDIPQDQQLQNMPAYMNFYRLVREKIKESAYHGYDIGNDGEVFLSFIIDKTGAVDNLYINPSSRADSTLKQVALRSVKNAAPFPPFPDELKNYTRLHFNISICFRSK